MSIRPGLDLGSERMGLGLGLRKQEKEGGTERKRLTPQQTERHSYEKCQYEEFKKRVAKMDELRAAKGGERSN